MKKFSMFLGSLVLAATVIWACKTTTNESSATKTIQAAANAASNLMFPKLYAQNGIVLDQLSGQWRCIRLVAVNGALMSALNDAQAVPGSLSLTQLNGTETLACFVAQNGGSSPNLPTFPPRRNGGGGVVAD